MESIDRLNRAIHYIEENLHENIDYAEISKITLSPISAFQRFFVLTTGMALSEYIRRRKLSRATDDLLQTDDKIIDIAVKYGYNSADAFSIAFKREYKISPSVVRQNQVKPEPFHRLFYSLSIKYIKGDVKMKTISNNRVLLDGGLGHNYGLPDCIKFLLECVGWGDKPDFWDIAAITGDTVAQIYNRNLSTGCEYCVSGYLAGSEYIKYIFDVLGYNHEYVSEKEFNADNGRYIRKIVEMIDRDIPVLVKTNLNNMPDWNSDVGTYCLLVGYDHGGQVVKLYFQGFDENQTSHIDCVLSGENKMDLILLGEKQREVTLDELYVKAMQKMAHWLTLPEQDGKYFGAAAFRAWADDIDAGRFEDENLPLWENYGVYVANLATNGGGVPTHIIKNLIEMNQAYQHLLPIYERIQKIMSFGWENHGDGKCNIWNSLDDLESGMNMDDVKTTMRDKEKRSKVASVLRDYAKRIDQVVEILNENVRML